MIQPPARRLAALCAAALALAPASAPAWESASHAGLTEQAALASALHERLARAFGLERGLYEVLEVRPADAPGLFDVLRLFSPTLGFQPDARGRQTALAWLVAGSAVADSPARHFANHFFDPQSRRGLSDGRLGGPLTRLRIRLAGAASGARLPRSGVAAVDWLGDPDNPMNVAGYWDQFERAVTAPTAAQRGRHLAGALTAAGALLHVLEDMGSPSHVRDDLAAHAEILSTLPGDRGSRFERIAALAFGRLGVPAADAGPEPRPLIAYLSAADRLGLADRTAAGFYSAGTLPAARSIERDARRLAAASVGLPAGFGDLDLVAAAGPDGATLRDPAGVCLARYRVDDGTLRFAIDDRCALEQQAVLLPRVGGYARAMLDTLFRGSLTLAAAGGAITVTVGPSGLGKGTLILLWDDGAGARKPFHQIEVGGAAAGAVLAAGPAAPGGASRVNALFRGVDDAGQPVRAAGSLKLP